MITVWFAFVKSPLGVNVRISKRFIAAVCADEYCSQLADMLKGPYELTRLHVRGIDEVYAISVLDPDSCDLVRLGVKDYLIASLR